MMMTMMVLFLHTLDKGSLPFRFIVDEDDYVHDNDGGADVNDELSSILLTLSPASQWRCIYTCHTNQAESVP
jgi:hypothetical protein